VAEKKNATEKEGEEQEQEQDDDEEATPCKDQTLTASTVLHSRCCIVLIPHPARTVATRAQRGTFPVHAFDPNRPQYLFCCCSLPLASPSRSCRTPPPQLVDELLWLRIPVTPRQTQPLHRLPILLPLDGLSRLRRRPRVDVRVLCGEAVRASAMSTSHVRAVTSTFRAALAPGSATVGADSSSTTVTPGRLRNRVVPCNNSLLPMTTQDPGLWLLGKSHSTRCNVETFAADARTQENIQKHTGHQS
jgi:hypothetical protein